MTEVLKMSGFLGLIVMTLVGPHQLAIVSGGDIVPPWIIGGHAHLGGISILAIEKGSKSLQWAVTPPSGPP